MKCCSNSVITLILLLNGWVDSFSQDSLSITGKVTDSQDKVPITFVSVDLVQKDSLIMGDVTQNNGQYNFYSLKPGKYVLQFSAAGYKTKKVPLKVQKNRTTTIDVQLECDNCPVIHFFGRYDFSQGGYSLLGTKSESDRSSLADSLGYNFFTDDIKVLEQFKKEWVFRKPSPKYACGYHYNIRLCREGKALESFSININCNEIVGDTGYFYFEKNKLRQFYGKLNTPFYTSRKFTSYEEGRQFYKEVTKDTSLILATARNWLEYEGEFQFTYTYPKDCRDCYQRDDEFLAIISDEIKKKYPGESFIVEEYGGSSTDMTVKIKCNKSLSDKFDLYPRESEYFGKWSPFNPEVGLYWKRKPK